MKTLQLLKSTHFSSTPIKLIIILVLVGSGLVLIVNQPHGFTPESLFTQEKAVSGPALAGPEGELQRSTAKKIYKDPVNFPFSNRTAAWHTFRGPLSESKPNGGFHSLADFGYDPESGARDNFGRFVNSLFGEQTDLPKGVYVRGIMQLPIVQQPSQNPVFVSNAPGVVTQYRDAAKNGITGLLAHNYLSGELFSQLSIGQEVLIVYGDQTIRDYRVVSVRRFQKLNPADLHSDYIDLTDGKRMTSTQVFGEFYMGKEHVTFQTCLKEDGEWDWGVVFVVAAPPEWIGQ